MAERRMFAKSIVLSDAFLDMPLSARCLYFTLGMLADDDGFVGSPKAIMRQCGASQDDMVVLLQKRFILAFESGVIVIKHWRMNNYLQNDRHHGTNYVEEMATLEVTNKGAYTEKKTMYTDCIQNVYLGKDSIGKDSIEKNIKHKYGEYKNVLLTDDELEKLKEEFKDYEDRIERLSNYVASTGKSYKSHYATIKNWARREKPKKEETDDLLSLIESKSLKGDS